MCLAVGSCAGTALQCQDAGPCATSACDGAKGACVATPKNEGKGCNDGSACTADDACQLGKCGGPAVNCDDKNPCTNDGCDPKTGCTNNNVAAGECNDGNACTLGDKCAGGACTPGATAPCTGAGPCSAADCNPKTGACDAVPKPDGSPCTAADPCAGEGKCAAGACVAAPKDCDDQKPCTLDTCDPKTGACGHDGAPLAGTACDADANGCTVGDSCAAGACVPGAAVACTDGGPCVVSQCDPKTGACALSAKVDGQPCTKGDACAGGKCVGTPSACVDTNPCTVDVCDTAKGCVYPAAPATCTDSDPCTADDDCTKTVCLPAGVTGCDDANPCTTDSCTPASGCIHIALGSGACSDGNPCTQGDGCKSGACVGVGQTCDDKNPCTSDSCAVGKGCAYVPNTVPCNDGNACTVADACKGGACMAGAPKACAAVGPCATVSCDPAGGGCATQIAADGKPCDADGSVCTFGDNCQKGACTFGDLKNCSDGKACTDDACDPKSGCVSTANQAPCNDGDSCTLGDVCAGGACKAGATVACNDADTCTTDACDKKNGCTYAPIPACVAKPKTWTVLVYMAADNNLEQAALDDIAEMVGAAQAEWLRFVVQIDRSKQYSAQKLGGEDFSTTRRYVIYKGALQLGEDLGELDTGDPVNLKNFIAWGATAHPADRVALILWDHGLGWRGYGTDDGIAGGSALDLTEMPVAIAAGMAAAKLGSFAFLGFDACLMGDLAVIDQLKSFAPYFIASEDIEPSNGWDYGVFGLLADTPSTGVLELCKEILNGYKEQSAKKGYGSSITLALLDTGKFQAVNDQVALLAYDMTGAKLGPIAVGVGVGRTEALEFGRSGDPHDAFHMVDVGDFAKAVATQAPSLGARKDALLQAIAAMTLHKVNGPVSARSTGVAIYYPPLKQYYTSDFAAKGLGSWNGFIADYFKVASTSPLPKLEKSPDGGKAGDPETTVLPLPYFDEVRCNTEQAALWTVDKNVLASVDPKAPVVDAGGKWQFDTSPKNLLHGACSLNYSRPAVACTGNGSVTSTVTSPWIDVSGQTAIAVAFQCSGAIPVGSKLRLSYRTPALGDWVPLVQIYSKGYPATATGTMVDIIDLTKLAPANKIRFRLGKQESCGVTSTLPADSAPAVHSFTVRAPRNPCIQQGPGTWCAGDSRVICDANSQVERREPCTFGCSPGAAAGKAVCKSAVAGLPGEVTLTCDGGSIQVTAKLVPGAVPDVVSARMYYGFSTDLGDTSKDRLFGVVPAKVGADGTLTAAWDQKVLSAVYATGATPLYSELEPAVGVEHREAPILDSEACNCKEPGNAAWSDSDQDGIADCADTDQDGDGVAADQDNCPWIANADQKDANQDGVGDACTDATGGNKNNGFPVLACGGFSGSALKRRAVLRVDIDLKTGAQVATSLIQHRKTGAAPITVPASAQLAPLTRPVKALGANVGAYQTSLELPAIPGSALDLAQFRTRTLDATPYFAGGKLKVSPNGVPISFAAGHGVTDYYLEIAVENLAGLGDSIVYRGPLPDGCPAPAVPCSNANNVRDCLGTCSAKALIGNGTCDKGAALGPHFKCSAWNFDGGDCTACDSEAMIEDCQGRCFPKDLLIPRIGDLTCNDSTQFEGTGSGSGPDLNCAVFAYDYGDCTYPPPLHPNRCKSSHTVEDCNFQCVPLTEFLAEPPGSKSSCQQRYNCARFGYDDEKCPPPASAPCPAKCAAHGTCASNGLCSCKVGWMGHDCSVPQAPAQSCCLAYATPLCSLPWVSALVCAAEPTCCTTAWSASCAARAVKLGAPCGALPACANSACTMADSEKTALVSVGRHHVVSARADGSLWAWGENAYLQLGVGDDSTPSYFPKKVVLPAGKISAIATGDRHSCAVVDGAAYCWGANKYGQLGIGKFTPSVGTPAKVKFAQSTPVAVFAGGDTSCATMANGAAYCWGRNDKSQLGTFGPTANVPGPIAVPFYFGVGAQLAVGHDHACGLSSIGVVYCWGSREYGATGDGKAPEPKSAGIANIAGPAVKYTALTCGAYHCCAYAKANLPSTPAATLCWGRNDKGQAGPFVSPLNKLTKPMPGVSPLLAATVTGISAGQAHTCGWVAPPVPPGQPSPPPLFATCFGSNSDGQIGTPPAAGLHEWYKQANPAGHGVKSADGGAPLQNVAQISSGGDTTCAVLTTGAVACWGSNTCGQLANGRASVGAVDSSGCEGRECGQVPNNVYTKETCGTCEAGLACNAAGQCAPCKPNCVDKVCGSDGCGGHCGQCIPGAFCYTGTTPDKCFPVFTCGGHCGGSWYTSAGVPCNCKSLDFVGLPDCPDAGVCK